MTEKKLAAHHYRRKDCAASYGTVMLEVPNLPKFHHRWIRNAVVQDHLLALGDARFSSRQAHATNCRRARRALRSDGIADVLY